MRACDHVHCARFLARRMLVTCVAMWCMSVRKRVCVCVVVVETPGGKRQTWQHFAFDNRQRTQQHIQLGNTVLNTCESSALSSLRASPANQHPSHLKAANRQTAVTLMSRRAECWLALKSDKALTIRSLAGRMVMS